MNKWLFRFLFPCQHRFYIEDIERMGSDLVRCMCPGCDEVFEAECGLHLPGELLQRQQDNGTAE